MSSGDLGWSLGLVLHWSLGMRDGPETIFNLVSGALFLAEEEGCGTSLREGKAEGARE